MSSPQHIKLQHATSASKGSKKVKGRGISLPAPGTNISIPKLQDTKGQSHFVSLGPAKRQKKAEYLATPFSQKSSPHWLPNAELFSSLPSPDQLRTKFLKEDIAYQSRLKPAEELVLIKQLKKEWKNLGTQMLSLQQWHKEIADLQDDQFLTSGISQMLGGANLPALSAWEDLNKLYNDAPTAIGNREYLYAQFLLKSVQQKKQELESELIGFQAKVIGGAEFGQTLTEMIRDISIGINSALLAYATGGASAAAGTVGASGALSTATLIKLGGGLSAMALPKVVQQAIEKSYKLRDEIEWGQIALDTLLIHLGDRLGERLFLKLPTIVGAMLPTMLGKTAREVLIRNINNAIKGRVIGVFQAIILKLYDLLKNYDGKHEAGDEAGFGAIFLSALKAVVKESINVETIIQDIIIGEVTHHAKIYFEQQHSKQKQNVPSPPEGYHYRTKKNKLYLAKNPGHKGPGLKYDAASQTIIPKVIHSKGYQQAMKLGYPAPPKGHFWRVGGNAPTLRKKPSFSGPKLRYDPLSKSFVP